MLRGLQHLGAGICTRWRLAHAGRRINRPTSATWDKRPIAPPTPPPARRAHTGRGLERVDAETQICQARMLKSVRPAHPCPSQKRSNRKTRMGRKKLLIRAHCRPAGGAPGRLQPLRPGAGAHSVSHQPALAQQQAVQCPGHLHRPRRGEPGGHLPWHRQLCPTAGTHVRRKNGRIVEVFVKDGSQVRKAASPSPA